MSIFGHVVGVKDVFPTLKEAAMSGLRRIRRTYTETFEGKPSNTPSKTRSSPRKRKPKSSADKVLAKISKAETPPKASDVKKGEIENVSTADIHGDEFEETEIEKITENNDKSHEKCNEIHDLHVEDGTQSDDGDVNDPNEGQSETSNMFH